MSERAASARRARRRWAAAGGGHDRFIATLRVALPLAIVALAALMALAPTLAGQDVSFVLAKDRVAVAREYRRVSAASYRGEDNRGRAFELTAKSAVQRTSTVPVVVMDELSAKLAMDKGPATIQAIRGRYDIGTDKVAIDGPVTFSEADGTRIRTRDVDVDLNTRKLASRGPVEGELPIGHFRADRLSGDLDRGVIRLEGGTRLHIEQGRARGAR